MKKRTKQSTSALLAIVLLVAMLFAGFAPAPVTDTVTITIDNEQSGNLAVTASGISSDVENLTLTGELNEDDILYLDTLTGLQNLDMSKAEYTSEVFPGLQSLSNLEELIIPEGTEIIASDAFASNSNLRVVYIPDSVDAILSRAFWNCTSLEYVRIPDTITSIGENAFQNCVELKIISFPETLSYLGNYAFAGCSKLETILFRRSIGFNSGVGVFPYSTVHNVYIPNNSQQIYGTLLNGCMVYEKVFYDISVINETEHTAFPVVNYGFEGLIVELFSITGGEAPCNFTAVSPSRLSINNNSFVMPGENTTVRYGEESGEPVEIESIESPRTLHLLESAITSQTELDELMEDITFVNVTLSDGSEVELPLLETLPEDYIGDDFIGWKLQKTSINGWIDVSDSETETTLGTMNEGIDLRLIACVDTSNTDISTTTPYIYTEIPVNVYDVANHPVQLTQGNNDLYKYGNEDSISEMQSQINNMLEGLQKTNAQVDLDKNRGYASTKLRLLNRVRENENKALYTPEDFCNDLVFYYYAESYENNVKPYVDKTTGADIARLLSDEETIIINNTWETSLPGRSIEVFQTNTDGSPIALILQGASSEINHIEPRHSSNMRDYVKYNTAGEIYRYTENYKITYRIINNKDCYVLSRKVKLRYQPGDANLDGIVNGSDASSATNYGALAESPFKSVNPNWHSEEFQMALACNEQVIEFNGDGIANGSDASQLRQYGAQLIRYPHIRW